MKPSSSLAACMLLAVSSFVSLAGQIEAAQPASNATYYPPPGSWAHKPASELGMNQELLDSAVAFAQTRESKREMDFSDQERIFGSMLGSVPDIRARTNGIVIYKGYVVASLGDTTWVDPTYSVAKSMLSTVTAIAVRDGRIRNLDEPVGMAIRDGGYGPPHNALVTWKMHLQQESEWHCKQCVHHVRKRVPRRDQDDACGLFAVLPDDLGCDASAEGRARLGLVPGCGQQPAPVVVKGRVVLASLHRPLVREEGPLRLPAEPAGVHLPG